MNRHCQTLCKTVENNLTKKRLKAWQIKVERVAGIEPARSAWEADRLPLHHTRAALR